MLRPTRESFEILDRNVAYLVLRGGLWTPPSPGKAEESRCDG